MSPLWRCGPRATAGLLTGLLILTLTSASPSFAGTALASTAHASAKHSRTYWVALTSNSSTDRGCSSAGYH